MNPDSIISVENLGKRYRLGAGRSNEHYTALRDVISDKAKSIFGRSQRLPLARDQKTAETDASEFWALKDVSFEVKPGEVVGIIGRNGAGKSTLLKILSRITEPTEGRIRIKGRVASLLEVGTGFHPELTGRENIYLNGAILGMSRTEIKAKFDEIVAFAETEKFLDTPVKRYSSGMYVRLAFAVAAHLEPEILIIDEVLAVGDAEFQKKCLGKMSSVATGGRTVLFVSHNLAAIQSLCVTALLLAHGKLIESGSLARVIAHYGLDCSNNGGVRRIGTCAEVRAFRLTPSAVESSCNVGFEFELSALADLNLTDLSLLVYASSGQRLSVMDFRNSSLPSKLSAGQTLKVVGQLLGVPLVDGDYTTGLYIRTTDFSTDLLDLATLKILPRAGAMHVRYSSNYRGLVELDFAVASCLKEVSSVGV